MTLPCNNKITTDYEISYLGLNFDFNCVSPLRDFSVKIEIKWNVLNLKSTLVTKVPYQVPH